jgi:hypothetical protein
MPYAASAAPTAESHVPVVLATSGPTPYTVGGVERTMRAADAFLRTASLGHLRIHTDVTPWLTAFTADPGCGGPTRERFETLLAPARVAADRAGYDPSHYADVIYALADSHCGFQGEARGHEVILIRRPTLSLVVHELGHTLGLSHAQASDCPTTPARCVIDDTGDPLSPMGSGMLDFSAYEKATLGWIPPQPHTSTAGRYLLAVPTFRTTLPQALIIDTTAGRYWIEYRSHPFHGLVVRFIAPRQAASPFAAPSVLILNPTKARRPWIARLATLTKSRDRSGQRCCTQEPPRRKSASSTAEHSRRT